MYAFPGESQNPGTYVCTDMYCIYVTLVMVNCVDFYCVEGDGRTDISFAGPFTAVCSSLCMMACGFYFDPYVAL